MTGRTETLSRVPQRLLPRSTLLRHLLMAVVAALVLLAVTYVVSDYQNFELAEVAYYLVAVAGLTVLTGLNGQISLGHGALMMIGAYTTALIVNHLGWPVPVALLAALVAGAVAGVLVGAAAARLRGPYLAGATLALAVGLQQIPVRYSGALGGSEGLSVNVPPPPLALGETFSPQRWQAWIGLAAAVLVLLLLANLVRSRVGRSFRAVRDDEVAAALAGLHVARTQVLAFVVSAACAGLGGGLLVVAVQHVGPSTFVLSLSLGLLTGIVLGGLGSLTGAVWGALVLVLLPQLADTLHKHLGLSASVNANIPAAVYGIVLAVVILVAPDGIQGALRRLAGVLRGPRSALFPEPSADGPRHDDTESDNVRPAGAGPEEAERR